MTLVSLLYCFLCRITRVYMNLTRLRCGANLVRPSLPRPGASPKRTRLDLEDSTMKPPSEQVTQELHKRNSSVASIRLDQTSISSASLKPASLAGLKHARSQSLMSLGSLQCDTVIFFEVICSPSHTFDSRPMTPDIDDASSVAESCHAALKRRRTEGERIQVLNGYAECGEMEPHRVFCTRCNKWVNLGKKQTYAVQPWEKHRIRCDQKGPVEPV